MYIATVPNRNSPPAILLRESYRKDGKVKSRTLANLSQLPPEQIHLLRRVLKGDALVSPGDAFEVVRTRPHGHVAAVVGTMRRLGLHRLLAPKRTRRRDLCEAMIAARILEPGSKLALARALDGSTLTSTLGETLGVEGADEDELYDAMDWLLQRQVSIETALAKRHLHDDTLVLYDLTSSYFEGRTCPLAQRGYSRDGKTGTLQIVFGLLCDPEGCPVATEVFEGNTGDPATLATQIYKLRERFGLQRVVLVGDRGMITEARIREELRPVEGLDWITSLRAPQVRKLVEDGALQLSLFDERDLGEITHPDFPGERLMACRNPLLARRRAHKRAELLAATEAKLEAVRAATQRTSRPLRGQDKIGVRVGRVLARSKMGKHFRYEITDDGFSVERDEASIAEEAALDGIYVVRTSVPAKTLSGEATVASYKSLSRIERAFRSHKTVDLEVRPFHHRLADRVRSHVFICMLAYYVEWHMRRALAPMLFDDDDRQAAEALRESVVAPAQRSPAAKRKAAAKRADDGMTVHSFQTLLADLRTIAKNRIQPSAPDAPAFDQVTRPTPLQAKALDLLEVSSLV